MASDRASRFGVSLLGAGALMLAAFAPAQAALPIQTWQTAAGARVFFVETHDLPMLDISVDFYAGSGHDPAGKSGLSSMTLHNLNSGGGGLNEDDITTRLANVGAALGGDLDQDRAGVTLRTLSSQPERDQALEILAKVIQDPEFPEKILEREKARTAAGLREAKVQPGTLAERSFSRLLFADHPYGRRSDENTIAAITRADVVDYYRTRYTSDTAVVAMIGDMSRAQAETVAESLTARLPRSTKEGLADLPPVRVPAEGVLKEISHPSSQSHIVIGYPGLKRIDPDYYPLLVGNFILGGGGFSSRLTNEVREKRGLAYTVTSYFQPMQEQGPFQLSLQTRKDQSRQALDVVRQTLRDFIENGPTERELDLARQNLSGGFPLRIDSNKKILDYLTIIGFYRLPVTFLEDYVGHVQAVTLEQIKDAFRRRIILDHMITVVVGGPVEGTAAAQGDGKAAGAGAKGSDGK